MSTVWIFTPRLPWTVVGFVTHFRRFVNGLEINVKSNAIYFEVNEICEYCCIAEYLPFESIPLGR